MNFNKPQKVLAWSVFFLSSLFAAFQFMLQSSISVMTPELMRAFDTDILGVTLISSCYFYTYLVLQTPVGIAVDRYGARTILNVSAILAALSCVCFAYSTSMPLAILSRMLMGLSTASAITVALYLTGKWFPPHRFALMAGFVEMIGILGGAFGQLVLPYGVDSPSIGWNGTMILSGVGGGVLALFIYFIVRDPIHVKAPTNEIENKNALSPSPVKTVLCNSQVWLIGLYSGFIFIIISGFASLWSIPLLKSLYGIGKTQASHLSALVFVGSALGAPLAGWLSNLMGRRKPIMILFGTLVLIFVTLVIYVKISSIFVMGVLLFCLGLVTGVYMVPFAMVRDLLPSNAQGTAMGFTNMMCILFGAPIVQPLIGIILSCLWQGHFIDGVAYYTLHDYQMAFMIFPIGIGLALLFLYFIQETFCKIQHD